MEREANTRRQARVQQSGDEWERYVQQYLNNKLEGAGIEVIRSKSQYDVLRRSRNLWKVLCIPVKSSGIPKSVWGDVDLIALKGNAPVAIVSCKTSLHGRLTETLFYSLLFKDLVAVRMVLATPDAGRQPEGQVWLSEWGSEEKPTKDRLLSGSYLSGVYVENVESFCRHKKPEEHTALGGIVKPLSALPLDLVEWSKEAPKTVRKGESLMGATSPN